MTKCLYSKNELKKFLLDFYNISGIITGIHDFADNDAAVQGNVDKKTFCRFCSDKSPFYVEQCRKNDSINIEKVKKEKKVLIYNCHMGFTEAIIPIIINDEAICVIFMGQILCSRHSEDDFYEKINRLRIIDSTIFDRVSLTDLHDAYLQTTFCGREQFNSYIDIAQLCARSIYNNHWIKYRALSIFEAFSQYVSDCIDENYSITEMAALLSVSTSHLNRIIKVNTGLSFTAYIHREKINHAKRLLTDTDMSIKNISLSVGIKDANYFSRLFKRYTSTTCGKYRQENK